MMSRRLAQGDVIEKHACSLERAAEMVGVAKATGRSSWVWTSYGGSTQDRSRPIPRRQSLLSQMQQACRNQGSFRGDNLSQ